MHAQAIISTHPDIQGSPGDALIRCIEECFDCAQTCISCADACTGEPDVAMLRQCVRLNLDCADICLATGQLATRQTGSNENVLRSAIELCAEACRVCAEECERHAGHHRHCAVCAAACRSCETVCREAAASILPKMQ